MASIHKPQSAAEWATVLVAVLLVLLGLPLLIMGAQLAMIGGSFYYVLFGAALIAAGGLMLTGSVNGALLYLVAWALTWPWAFWEVGLDGWGLLPRLFGPTLVAIAVALTVPVLRRIGGTTISSGRSMA
ncbi:glycerol dehydrogenase [Acetobacter fallax]|uniref:Glycerol dehydrogenase n=1 Tax=Acetobacter fallax TaxID=1737473 RepID=A0ABX0KEU0_9PROT|nr:glycerol dehydrogenase [Acetobacter fallax]NHO32925.1 glycerol dehydrogenase [Acetobacter fallax]NHO36546.1 glycerol dehydrogenase [Acetobacter fallax]